MQYDRRVMLLLIAAVLIGGYFLIDRNGSDKEASGAPMVQVTVPRLEGAAAIGKTVFNKNCASCHGTNAAGQEGIAPPLIHKIYEPSHHADGSFFLAVRQGVRAHHWPFGNMPPIEDLTERDVDRIVAYVRTLQRANGIQ
ncbi:c-type cytochrome [Roseibium sp. Sym1]|uniref:c-type cytochrome n=1 Tax=Roseibium sp. Sym1 TaxID=3016006 RepID=UPI0022B590BB|nr:cytochrome c [Roseibium sp. Sym1]